MADFRYYNRNDDPTIHRNDCVTRAISLASGLPYAEIRRKLRNTASLLDCESSLCPTCYSFLIQEVLGGVPKDCHQMTVEEFADLHPNGVYLVRMDGHLSAIVENCVFDTFDCRGHLLTNAWEVR
jgi:hypothetical protein